MPVRWGAVVLAAGAASRMGARPKCLLQIDGLAIIARQLAALQALGVPEVAVVLGHYADAIARVLPDMPQLRSVRHPDPDAGQNSSLHLGLHALSQDCEAVMVLLADQPLVDQSVLRALMQAFESRDASVDVLVPWHATDAVPGNPVVMTARVRQDILAGSTERGCKQWQQTYPQAVQRWATTDRAYFTDLDTPEDVHNLRVSTGWTIDWPL